VSDEELTRDSEEELTRDSEVEHVSLRLAQGLKACRSMVANYRAMLDGEANDNVPEAPEPAVPREADEA
jgi:hypothetical protein